MLAVLFRTQIPFLSLGSRAPLPAERGERTRPGGLGGTPPLWGCGPGAGSSASRTAGGARLHSDADFAEQERVLERGDRLVFYCDGFFDRFPDQDGAPATMQLAGPLRFKGASQPIQHSPESSP